jgi:tetratricopeptide (TPR) repeat protein
MHSILLNRFLTASLIWVVASFLVHELCSLDIWWQLAIGEDILQQLRVPEINIYSAGAFGQPYHDSHWLFQVLLAISHRLAGLNGPILCMITIWGLTLFLVYKESRTVIGTTSAVLITVLAAGASAERFLPRPEIISFLMVALFYSRLHQEKYNTPTQMLLLVSLQVIWVNSHGLFVIGPFMVGCYWLMHAIKFIRKEDNSLKPLSTLLVLLGASLLLSPYGTGALEYSYLLFHEVGQAAPDHMKGVNELSPTFGAAAMGASAFWFFMILLILAPLSAVINYRKLNLARLLIVSALCLAALTGRRNIVLFAVAAAPFITENLAPYVSRLALNSRVQKGWQAFITCGMLLWSGYPLSGAYYLHMEIPARTRLGVTPDFFPHGLVDFINEHHIKGQVYNSNRLGGFYLYHFFPDRIPFIDGRWEIYGEPFFKAKKQALENYGNWEQWATQYQITNVLLHHTSPESRLLVPALYNDPQWSLVYYDFAAAFFVRNNSLGSAQPILFSPSSRILMADVRPDSRLMLNSFYRNLGLKPLLLENLNQSLRFGLHKEKILLEMAKINMDLGRYPDAKNSYQQLLKIAPYQADALSDLAFISYQQHNYVQALDYSTQAMATEPDNLDIRFNHTLILVAAGQQEEATRLLSNILAIRPDYWKAKQLLKEIRK